MSGDRIDVIFGARVGELIAGVAEAKEAFEGQRRRSGNPQDSDQGLSNHTHRPPSSS
jgi:hypothetical protein